MQDVYRDLMDYFKIEGINPNVLLTDKKEQKISPETISQLIIGTSEMIARAAISLTELKRKSVFSLSKTGALKKVLEGNHPWITTKGNNAEEKWINHQRNLLFPEEILRLFEAVEPGQKEAWEQVLNDVLSTSHEDEPRMAMAGILTGLSVAIIQNGELFLRAAGIPTEFMVGSQIIISLLGHGVRWRASETFWNVEALKDNAGKSVTDIFEQLDLPNIYKNVNWQNLTSQILERYKQLQTDSRFAANIRGLTVGLVAGNMLFGNVGKAVQYGLVTMSINYVLGEKYPDILKNMISRFVDTQLKRRKTLENSRTQRKIDDLPTIGSHMDSLKFEHERRKQATLKNTFQGSVSAVLPVLAAFISNFATQEGLRSEAYTWSVVASTVLDRSSAVMGRKDSQILGDKAQIDMEKALEIVLQNSQRRPPMKEDRNDLQGNIGLNQKKGSFVIHRVGTPDYEGRDGKVKHAIELNKPFSLEEGECAIILGGVQSGKSTLLKILTGRLNGRPSESNITLGDAEIGQAPRETLQDIFYTIPLENNKQFSTRESLAKVASKANVLGKFSRDQIQSLLSINSLAEASGNQIVQLFLKYCAENNILQGDNGITEKWFVGQNFIPSGSQQAFFNLVLSTCFDGSVNPKIICADDPSDKLDERAKKEWISFVEKILPKSGHRMLITTNDTYNLANGDGWLAMDNLGSVLDISQQKAVSFKKKMDFNQLVRPIDARENETDLPVMIENLKSAADLILNFNQADLLKNEAIYCQLITSFTTLLKELKYFIEESDQLLDDELIKTIILNLTKHVSKVLNFGKDGSLNIIKLVNNAYEFNTYEFSAFVLLHELETFVDSTIGESNFKELVELFSQYNIGSTYTFILNVQDKMRKVGDLLGEKKLKKIKNSLEDIPWIDLNLYLQKPFYRYAFFLDFELVEVVREGLLEAIEVGFFDNNEDDFYKLLNLECDPTIHGLTIGYRLFNTRPNLYRDIIAATRHRQLKI